MLGVLAWLAVSADVEPWIEANQTDDGITVWYRDVHGKRIREVKATGVVDAAVDLVWFVLRDVEHFVEFMPYVTEARVLSEAGPNARYVYQHLDPPIVDERDYTLKITSEKLSDGSYFQYWSPANDKGPPRTDGVVRLEICEGNWTAEPLNPTQTRITYWLYTDPGGSIPSWVANMANTRSLPDLVRSVRNRSIDPTWKRD